MGERFYGKHYLDGDRTTYVGPQTFLNLPLIQTVKELQEKKPDVTIIGAPYDQGGILRPGARYGPRGIRDGSMMIMSPPYQHFNIETGVDPFELFGAVDYGDVTVHPNDVIETHNRITNKVAESLDIGATPIVLGGDHSITFANARALAKKFKNKIGMIHIDAHADCSDSGLVGFKYDHGAHIRRIYDLGCLLGKNYTLIAAREFWPGPEIYKWMRDVDFQWFTMMDVEELGVEPIAKEAVERATSGTEAVWISWDVDSFDASCAPGTTAPTPCGLTAREGVKMMRLMAKELDVDRFGFDVVEVCPQYDAGNDRASPGGVTSALAARLIHELLGGLAVKKQGLRGGTPVRPKMYRGKGHTLDY